MATSTIKQNALPTGVFTCSVPTANLATLLFNADGSATTAVTGGTVPTDPQKCIYQIDKCSGTNTVIVSFHFDSSEGKKTYLTADHSQNYSVRWYRAF